MSAPTTRYSSFLLLAGSMTLVGIYVGLSKPLTAAIPVFALAFLRFAIAAVAMVPWTPRTEGEPPLTATEHRLLFVMSFFGNFLFSICMLYGVSMTTATAAGVILATLPAVVALLSWIVLREQLSARVMLAVTLAVGGIALLQMARPGETSTRGATLLGNLLMFGAVVCEATYVIVGKRLAATRAPLRVSALINLWGLALITPFGLWQLADFGLGSVDLPTWGLLVFYSLAASLFAVWMWVAGLKHVPANQAGVFTVALPLAATAVGTLVLGEAFTVIHATALVLASAGVVLIATDRPRAAIRSSARGPANRTD
ncbi:MAG TPA: DMT family transporter [Burkholderiaceae bacterium]|nr:DMT family transporter [Burkholderiaceae bacterium]HQR72355.1 DMT family transporter [Burkholderiaceae bacterium]